MLNYEVYIPGSDDVAHINGPWDIQRNIVETKSEDGPTEIIDVDIPNDQISTVNLVIAVKGLGPDAIQGGTYRAKMRVKKENGNLVDVKVLDLETSFSPDLVHHGSLLCIQFNLTQEPSGSEIFKLNESLIQQLPLYESPFYEDRTNYAWAQALVSDFLHRMNIPSGPSFSRKNRSTLKAKNRDISYTLLNEAAVIDDVDPQRTVERNGLTFKTSNGKIHDIDKTELNLGLEDWQQGLGFTVDAGGVEYVFYSTSSSGDKIKVVQGPNFDNPTTISTDEVNPAYHPLSTVSYGDSQHVFYTRPSDNALRHATNESGSWTVETVDTHPETGTQLDVVVTSSGTIHVTIGFTDDLRHYKGSTGSWTLEDTISNETGDVALGIDPETDNLGVAFSKRGDDSDKIFFREYDGTTWSSEEIIEDLSSTARFIGGINVERAGGKWYVCAVPIANGGQLQSDASRSQIILWTGSSGSFSKTTVYTANQSDPAKEAFITKVVMQRSGNGNVHFVWSHRWLRITRYAFGNPDDGFNVKTIDDHEEYGSFGSSYNPDKDQLLVAHTSKEKRSSVHRFKTPRNVDLQWKAVAEVRNG